MNAEIWSPSEDEIISPAEKELWHSLDEALTDEGRLGQELMDGMKTASDKSARDQLFESYATRIDAAQQRAKEALGALSALMKSR